MLATSRQHVLDKLQEIESLGGEGLMLRKPASYVILFISRINDAYALELRQYEGRRSGTLLKIKVRPLLP